MAPVEPIGIRTRTDGGGMRARTPAAGRRGRAARALAVLAVATAGLAAVIVPAAPAAAAASLTAPSSGFVGSGVVTIAGEKDAESRVRVAIVGGGPVCEIGAGATAWSCQDVPLPTGVVELAGIETLADGSEQPFGSVRLRVLGPPRIDGAGGPTLTAGRFTGEAEPGAAVEVRAIGRGGASFHACPPALPDGFWSCIVPVETGQYRVSARQSVASIGPERSAWSTATEASVDRAVPAAPTIDLPATGTRTPTGLVRASGTGEPGAALQLFVAGDLSCEVRIDGSGSWACGAMLPSPGDWELRALQRDPAGNFSSASTGVRVEWIVPGEGPGDGAGDGSGNGGNGDDGSGGPGGPDGPTTGPSPGPSEPGAPGTPGGPGDGPASPTPGGGEPGDDPTDGSAPGAAPGPPGQIGPPPDGTSNWGTPTGFGGSLPTAAQIVERGALVAAPLVALGYLLLIALPLRGFATHVMPRIRLASPRLTGRNRGFVAEEDGPIVAPALTAVGVFAGAAIIAAVEGGIDLELRYLRLTAAIGLGLLVLAGIGVLLPAGVVRRTARAPIVTRLLPGILVIAIGAALLTRVAELRPGILIGVLVAASVVGVARFRVRVALAVAQLVAVAALALIGWALHDALTPSTGFWVSFVAETAAAVALGGFGSLLVMLLPVGSFPGRAVYAVSRVVWGIAALAVASVTGAIVAAGASFPLTELALAAAGVGAVLIGTTVWTRWVEPALL